MKEQDNKEKKETRGRKAEIKGKPFEKHIYAKISNDDYERIVKLAEYMEIPKMTLVRNMILNSLDEIEFLKKIGILGLTKHTLKTSEFLKKLKEIKKENRDLITE